MIDTTPITPNTPLRDLGLRESLADPSANDLDKDAFLQLLVAQLRYQDPLNPNDPAEFMATTAQFTVVEKLEELTQQGANTAIISGLSMASSLVGRTVTFVGADDAVTTGVVSSAQVSNGDVRLVTDNGVVDLSTVIGIGATEAQTPPAPEPSKTFDAPSESTSESDVDDSELDIPVVPTLPQTAIAIPPPILPNQPDEPTPVPGTESPETPSDATAVADTDPTKEFTS